MESSLIVVYTSEEDEAAFLQSRLKLFIPRRPKEPFDPDADLETTTRKFIVQGPCPSHSAPHTRPLSHSPHRFMLDRGAAEGAPAHTAARPSGRRTLPHVHH
jgi:hypothetical protein